MQANQKNNGNNSILRGGFSSQRGRGGGHSHVGLGGHNTNAWQVHDNKRNKQILALHKIAYQSSTKVPADLAVDGGLSQHYFHGSCTHTSDYEIAAGTYWEVDLCGKAFIHHVTIYNREDCCGDRLRDVELYIGNERRSYRLVGFHKGVVGSVYTFELENDVFGQWVRITRIPSVIDILALCEVQVFGYKLQLTFRDQLDADALERGLTFTVLPSHTPITLYPPGMRDAWIKNLPAIRDTSWTHNVLQYRALTTLGDEVAALPTCQPRCRGALTL
ncbi:pentraxin fusion protein-like [Mercenaria mercenaria]|uniref:pentraxin fusion protein-like n=1 Tax=Mercenaria mercenaria TaxID=6596 RepID=UPI00234EE61A|nr:pentraxin fusion protein-like [Mercenaria mercenaria]